MLVLADSGGLEVLIGRLHPLLLHFPIALLVVAAGLETIRWVAGKREAPSPTAAGCLLIGTAMALLSVWAGWELAEHEGEAGQLVELHRWTAIATLALAVLASIALMLRRWKGRDWTGAHVGLTLLAAVMVAVSGHFGAEMVWGEGWVLEPLKGVEQETPAAVPMAEAPPTWGDVESILTAHCEKCHGPKRQKAGLQLVPWAAMFEGAIGEWVVAPGDVDASLLCKLITLPAGSEDAMPPEGKADPLTPAQVTTIKAWIAGGATGPGGQHPPKVVAVPAPSP